MENLKVKLVELKGSEKQKFWATKIRADMLSSVEALFDTFLGRDTIRLRQGIRFLVKDLGYKIKSFEEGKTALKEAKEKVLELLSKEDSSKWFIENRRESGDIITLKIMSKNRSI